MYIDPQVKAFLDDLEAQAAPPAYEIPLEDSRVGFSQLFQNIGPPPRFVYKTDELMIPGPRGDIRTLKYVPRESDDNLPILVFYHGGGTVMLAPEDYVGLTTTLADEANCIVLVPDYRLAPENPFPAPLEDCFAVYNWTLQHAEEISGDPERVAVAGDSGGGYLCAAVCLEAKLNNVPQPLHQILMYPMIDNASKTPSKIEFDYFIDEAIMDWVCHLAFGDKCLDPRASPILAIDHTGLAPATIITAKLDPLRDEGKMYANKLRKAGVPTNYHCYEGMIHGFLSMGGIIDVGNLGIMHVASILKLVFSKGAAIVTEVGEAV